MAESRNSSEQRALWQRAKLFIYTGRHAARFTEPPAMELGYRIDEHRIFWSHTPGRMREGEYVPMMHLPDRDLEMYLLLLRTSAEEADRLRRMLRNAREGEEVRLPEGEVCQVHENRTERSK